ncbi:MAG: restriction endonuclease subunit S [Marinomonas foliarum]|uniref:restriction endonuclease subunit S n=1 Tax=Marinomonas foliarum TaxID=491950 RepID=UPI003F958348
MVWDTAKLGDVCNIIGGGTPSKSNDSFYEGIIPWATVRDMRYDFLSKTELSITEEAIQKSSTNLIPAGTIITATRVGLGKVCILEQDTAINQDLKAIIPKSQELDKTFLYWWLKSIAHLIIAAGTGATVQGVKLNFIKGLEIPLPPISEQKRIVSILDTVFADLEQARVKTEQNLTNARELFDSYLQKVFSQKGEGWKQHKLSELCKLISGQHIDAKDYNNDNIGIGYLTGPSDFGVFNPIVTKWSEYPKRTAIQGDILITVKGSGVGKINMMSADELAISRQLMAVRPMYSVGELIYWFLSMQFDYFQSLANGAAIPGISRHDVLDLELSLPALNDQTSVLKKIKKFNTQTLALEKIYTDKIRAIDELKKSILQKAFSGELTKTVE